MQTLRKHYSNCAVSSPFTLHLVEDLPKHESRWCLHVPKIQDEKLSGGVASNLRNSINQVLIFGGEVETMAWLTFCTVSAQCLRGVCTIVCLMLDGAILGRRRVMFLFLGAQDLGPHTR